MTRILALPLQLEELKLLSTAESLGALSLVERAFETDPGTIASLSIPPFLGSIGKHASVGEDTPIEADMLCMLQLQTD